MAMCRALWRRMEKHVLGVAESVQEFVGKRIAIVHRTENVKEKWAICSEEMHFSAEEIARVTAF